MTEQKEFEKLFKSPWSYSLFISHVAKLYKDRKIVHIDITNPDSITLMFNVKQKTVNDQQDFEL
jgi:hypothetical protein